MREGINSKNRVESNELVRPRSSDNSHSNRFSNRSRVKNFKRKRRKKERKSKKKRERIMEAVSRLGAIVVACSGGGRRAKNGAAGTD